MKETPFADQIVVKQGIAGLEDAVCLARKKKVSKTRVKRCFLLFFALICTLDKQTSSYAVCITYISLRERFHGGSVIFWWVLKVSKIA